MSATRATTLKDDEVTLTYYAYVPIQHISELDEISSRFDSIVNKTLSKTARAAITIIRRQPNLLLHLGEFARPSDQNPINKGFYIVVQAKQSAKRNKSLTISYPTQNLEADQISRCYRDNHTTRAFIYFLSNYAGSEDSFKTALQHTLRDYLLAVPVSRIPQDAITLFSELIYLNVAEIFTAQEIVSYCKERFDKITAILKNLHEENYLADMRVRQIEIFTKFAHGLQTAILYVANLLGFKIDLTIQPQYLPIEKKFSYAETRFHAVISEPFNLHAYSDTIKEQNLSLDILPISHGMALDNSDCLALGDLHASVKKLLVFLLHENILQGWESVDYDQFVELYSATISHNDDTINFANIFQVFGELITKFKLANPTSPKVILIGDTLCDREGHDYFNFRLFKKIREIALDMKIVLSNHDRELIFLYETGEIEQIETVPWITKSVNSDIIPDTSLQRLAKNIRNNILDKQEIVTLITEYYYPMIVGLACSINETTKEFILFTHAPVGVAIIPILLAELNIEPQTQYAEKSPFALAANIHLINAKITALLREKKLSYATRKGTALFELIWFRGKSKYSVGHEADVGILSPEWKIRYVFGHVNFNDFPLTADKVNLNNAYGYEKKPAIYLSFYAGNQANFLALREQSLRAKRFNQVSAAIANSAAAADEDETNATDEKSLSQCRPSR